MNVKQLRQDAQAQLRIRDRALRKRVAKAMDAHRTITRDDALLLVAADAGITISKYTQDQATLDRIGQLLRGPATSPHTQAAPRRAKAVGKTIRVTVGRKFDIVDPLLTMSLLNEAKMMSEHVYPVLYVFENSVRELIRRVLQGVHGDDWWSEAAPSKVKQVVQGRMAQEKRQPWHGRRRAGEIFYTDIEDLGRIVTSNCNWPYFAPLLPDHNWFTIRISEINLSRRIVAHNNPLARHDLKRLEVYFEDWERQIAAVRHLIP